MMPFILMYYHHINVKMQVLCKLMVKVHNFVIKEVTTVRLKYLGIKK